jgi:hypothetical protein
MEQKENRNRTNEVAAAPTMTGAPNLQRTDPRAPESSNAILYHRKDQAGGLDNFSANIPFGLDAIAAFERAMKKKVFDGVPIRACALVVGGTRDVRSRTKCVHGGEVIAEWSMERGLVAQPGWKERVRGLPRPNVVMTPRIGGPI